MENTHMYMKHRQGDIFSPGSDYLFTKNGSQPPKTNSKTNATTTLNQVNPDIKELPGSYPKNNVDKAHEISSTPLQSEILNNPVEYLTEKLNDFTTSFESNAIKSDITDFQEHLKGNIEDSTTKPFGSIETIDLTADNPINLPSNTTGIQNMPNKSKKSKKTKNKPKNKNNSVDKSPNETPSKTVENSNNVPDIPPALQTCVFPTPPHLKNEPPKLENDVDQSLRNEAQPSTHDPIGEHDNLGKIDSEKLSQLESQVPEYEPYKFAPVDAGKEFKKEPNNIENNKTVPEVELTDPSPFPNQSTQKTKIEKDTQKNPDISGVTSLPDVATIESPNVSSQSNNLISKGKDVSGVTTLPVVAPISFPQVPGINTQADPNSNRDIKSDQAKLDIIEKNLPTLSSVSHEPTLDPKEYSRGSHGELDSLDAEPEYEYVNTINSNEEENKPMAVRKPKSAMVHDQASKVQDSLDQSGPDSNLYTVDKLDTTKDAPDYDTNNKTYVKDTKHADVINNSLKSTTERNVADRRTGPISFPRDKQSISGKNGSPILAEKIAPGIPFTGLTVRDSLVGYTHLQDVLDSLLYPNDSKDYSTVDRNIATDTNGQKTHSDRVVPDIPLPGKAAKNISDSSTHQRDTQNVNTGSINPKLTSSNPQKNSPSYSITGTGSQRIAPGIPFSGATVADSLIGYTYHDGKKHGSNGPVATDSALNTERKFDTSMDSNELHNLATNPNQLNLGSNHSASYSDNSINGPSSDGNLDPEFIATYARIGEELNETIQPHQYQIIDSKENPLEPIDDINMSSPKAQEKLLPESNSPNMGNNQPLHDRTNQPEKNTKDGPILIRDSDPSHREAVIMEMKNSPKSDGTHSNLKDPNTATRDGPFPDSRQTTLNKNITDSTSNKLSDHKNSSKHSIEDQVHPGMLNDPTDNFPSDVHASKFHGTMKTVKGTIKESFGNMTGNEKMQDEGLCDKELGKAETKLAELKK